ncbi:MAG: helix-turn-helix transcriptional regulator [Paraglaciecola sp.]|uniref:helix-turn-helix domain-containing protein n=1 Tax=Paraglaciecola sp. TaxID=1920173 RepID=UPI003267DE4C
MGEFNSVSKLELSRKLSNTGFETFLLSPAFHDKDALMLGNLDYQSLPSGINVHVANMLEQENAQCSTEIEPSISVCILLEGVIEFSLNQNTFSISAEHGPRVFAYANNKTVIFMRRLVENNKVKKVNISVSQEWMQQRLRSFTSLGANASLFENDIVVKEWSCDQQVLNVCEQFFEHRNHQNMLTDLYCEQYALTMFSHSVKYLLDGSYHEHSSIHTPIRSPFRAFEKEVDAFIFSKHNGADIAKKLGTSLSTLQRYFKEYHRATLSDYLRTKRLEAARHALIFEGKTIGEVAYMVGYNHSSNFVSAFKKHFNQTPTELVKQYAAYKV